MDTITGGRIAAWLDHRSGRVNRVFVSHSWRGYELEVEAVPSWRWLIASVTESTLSAVGHPCCGRGLGRMPFLGGAAYRTLAAAIRLGSGTRTFSTHISAAEAAVVSPAFDQGADFPVTGEDEDGSVWDDGCFVAFRCEQCGNLIEADTWRAAAEELHRPECRS
ncbi:hypothetical protein GCM10009744_63870 [Kribbella alba]|uniref:Uncharacterized protein n=1 Tax=Kribbella alba TaxID=190197 RepID=A0ABN2FY90_9ACTN